jgi:hypothetical protein
VGLDEARRRRLTKKPGSDVPGTAAAAKADDGRVDRKANLKIKTGRKGRSAAELSRRRSTLKKRDRTADKIYKAEAALERKTVVIPEYVFCPEMIFVCCLPSGRILWLVLQWTAN